MKSSSESQNDDAGPDTSWSDRKLINACLLGDEAAWHALVEKYQQMVYAVAFKYCRERDQAADLFQAIWLDAFNDLPKLRKKNAFPGWLAQLARNKCYHWKRRQTRRRSVEIEVDDDGPPVDQAAEDPEFADALERDQLVRQAIARLDPRCREMIRLLFFVTPPLPYKEVAERLGLATGSIGFIRGRCLERLERSLREVGSA